MVDLGGATDFANIFKCDIIDLLINIIGVPMSELLKRIENEALGLSSQERAFLADRLLSSLGDSPITDIEAAWVAEAERRYEDYKKGNRPGIPANQVFAEADQILK